MDVTRFGITKSGQLLPIRILDQWSDYAFIPDHLPPNWRPDEHLWPLIAKATGRIEGLNWAGSMLSAPTLLFRPLQRREAITSNSIEGTHVSPQQLLLFEIQHDEEGGSPRVPQRQDWWDVRGYDRTLSYGCRRIQDGARIDRTLFCELHRMLLQSERGKQKRPGQIRDVQVYIEGRRYIPPPAAEVFPLLDNLESFLNDREDYDPLVRAFVAHYQFEAIHPFEDGNGRVGRMILSLCLYKWLNHSHPWLYLSEYFDKNRKEYIQRLFAVSTNGDWQEWLDFCLRGAVEQAELALACCRKLHGIREDYEQRVGRKSARLRAIVASLFSNPMIEVAQLARDLKCSYNTARKDVQRLVDEGILHEVQSGRPKLYCAKSIFAAAYLEE